MSPRERVRLHLTQQATDDLVAIVEYSVSRWGERVAEKYLDDLEAGLRRIQENPELLRHETDLPPSLQFYRVNHHLLACDVQPHSIVVLTVISASMDLPSRLAKLQPTLAGEVEILHRRLEENKRRTSR